MSTEKANEKSNAIPVNLDQVDLERMRDQAAEGAAFLPYASNRGSGIVRPEDLGRIKGNSITAMEQQTDIQMQQLVQQMKVLADQAKALQNRKIVSEKIYLAEMRFEPVIGKTYFLYSRDGQNFMSLVAPNEWGRSRGKAFEFVAKVYLLADHTWDVLEMNPDFEVS